MAADADGAAHKGIKEALKEWQRRVKRRLNGRAMAEEWLGQLRGKKIEQFWGFVIGISKRQADCF